MSEFDPPHVMRSPAPLLLLVLLTMLAAPRPAPAAERCGPPLVAGGQPALVAVVMDGISSQELESGTSDPLAVPNWCPALPDGRERHLPSGLETGFRTWAGLATADGQKPQTETCRPGGGLGGDTCLVGRLADAGAIVLPYSYAGARVSRAAGGASQFTFNGYTPQDTFQEPAASIAQLDGMLESIATAWPSARVVIVAHSYGGTVASGWWLEHVESSLGPVTHVFTLDSPINGVEQCAATALLFSQAVAAELCDRWNTRDAFDQRLLSLGAASTLTTIGTPDDPTYEPTTITAQGLQVGGGGRLRPQVVYRCSDAGEDPGSACIASPPSVVNADPECSGHGPGIQGRAGHFAVIACPQTTRTILAGTSTGVLLGRRDRPRTVRVNGRRLRSIAWTAWGAATARGHGRLGAHRRAVVLTRARPCDAVHRFAYTRVKVVGVAAARRGCPRSRPTATGAP